MRVIAARNAGHAKVLMVTNMWPHDEDPGYGIFVKRQIDSLRAHGLDFDLLFIEGYRTKLEYVRAAWYMLRLNRAATRPLLVHGHGGETAVSLCWYVRGKVLLSYCGSDLLGRPHADGRLVQRSRPRRFFFEQMARLMSATITKSAEMQATLPPSARSRNVVIPNGVDRSLFRPMPRDEARRQLGWPSEKAIVLFAADPARPRKRFWLAEAACEAARQRTGPLELIIANDLDPDSLPVYMAGADCLLLTSSIEGSPNVVKEALACDLPVISTDVGDVRELLQAVEPSWICPAEPERLAAALVECLTTRPRSNGRDRSQWLDQQLIAARLLELYRRLAPELRDELSEALAGQRDENGSHTPGLVGDATLGALSGASVEPIQT